MRYLKCDEIESVLKFSEILSSSRWKCGFLTAINKRKQAVSYHIQIRFVSTKYILKMTKAISFSTSYKTL